LFSWSDTELVQEALLSWATFVKGALVGSVLPEGIDDQGQVVFTAWQSSVVDDWRSPLGWCERSCIDDAADLVPRWLEANQTPFWREVLTRAMRIHAAANQPNPLDVAIPTALTGLETLAWAVLVVDQDWIRPNEDPVTAAGMIRMLLRWARVDTKIPVGFASIAEYATGVQHPDLVTAITQVRNRLVHPSKKRTSQWPSRDAMFEAWRLSMEALELVMLRILRYEGTYGDRRHLSGRHVGDVDVVPWVKAKTQLELGDN
jgi:hypothetical protein